MSLLHAHRVGLLLLAGSASSALSVVWPAFQIGLLSAAWADTDCATGNCPANLPPEFFKVPGPTNLRPGGLPWYPGSETSGPPSASSVSDFTHKEAMAWWQAENMSSAAALETLDAPPGLSCLGAYEPITWDRQRVNLPWLKIHLNQVESLQPQRCVTAPNICLTGC